MLDRNVLRNDASAARQRLALRGEQFAAILDEFSALDLRRRESQTQLDALRAELNTASKQIGELMKSGQKDEAEAQRARARELSDSVSSLDAVFAELEAIERGLLLSLPNYPAEDIPTGGEDKAEVLKTVGDSPRFDFTPRDHVELNERLQLVNFEAGSRVSGAGFPFIHGNGALLQRALINYMLDLHIGKHGYTELRPPFIVHPRCAEGTGQLPKFGEQMYHVTIAGEEPPTDAPPMDCGPAPHFFLVPTAEVPVANYYREQVLESPRLPVKFCAYSPCFRVEAGSYGKDVRGLTRLHQFEKVELVRVADPQTSYEDHEAMTREAETVLESLGLSYRRKVLPSGDMAFASAKTYDLEVYAPGADAWLEVSSISNTTDFQARRANVRFRREKGGKPEFVHLLNASGVALPRLLIALLETYQTAEGDIELPEVLHSYMRGQAKISPPEHGAPWV